MNLHISKSKNAESFYIAKSYVKENGSTSSTIVRKLGTLEQLLVEHGPTRDDVLAWAKNEVKLETEKYKKEQETKTVLVPFRADRQMDYDKQLFYRGGYLFLQSVYYGLQLNKTCRKLRDKYKFKYDINAILSDLIYARVLEPASKRSSFHIASDFLEKPSYNLHDVYRALDVLGNESDFIQAEVYKNSHFIENRNDKILYYDCTNYYFEIEHEKGIRKYGVSKEHRPNPIVEMGMFIDGSGIPLAFCINPGNINEQKTLLPLEQQIIRDFEHSKFVVCTDAGLSSVANRKFNNVGKRAFITAQSIKKMKSYQKEWALSPYGWKLAGRNETYNLDEILSNDELCEKYRLSTFYKETWFNENDIEQRYIVTFSLKYMNYQRTIRNEQIDRARKALVSESKNERHRQSDFKRFIQKLAVSDNGELATKKVYVLDEDKIFEEEKYDGFYAVATNLEDEAPEIVRINSKRWEIEESFRIMKTEFSSRPVYLSRDDRISAHFTTCFLALTIFRYLEHRLGNKYTCSDILNNLKNIKFYKTKEGYIPLYTRNEFTEDLHSISGFRTDYQIIPFSNMKKIFKASKS